jgi:hypothetical protein
MQSIESRPSLGSPTHPTPTLMHNQSSALVRVVAPHGPSRPSTAALAFIAMMHTYTSRDHTKVLKLGMTGFESEKALAFRCTHDAQLWHDILWATGSALETSKCSYQSMRFDHMALRSLSKMPIVTTLPSNSCQAPKATRSLALTKVLPNTNGNNTPSSRRKPTTTVAPLLSATHPSTVPASTIPLFSSVVWDTL